MATAAPLAQVDDVATDANWLRRPRKSYPLVEQGPLASLIQFFLATYAITWFCFILIARLPAGAVPAALRQLVLLIGVFAPSYVALALTARDEGRAGLRDLLGRLIRWRVGLRWYVFAAGFMAAIKLSAALVHRAATGAWPRFGDEAWYVITVALVVSTPVQAGEEIGWRGYALPRMAARIGLGPAGVILGVIWACWHLPLFFMAGSDTYGQAFPVYLLQVTAISVAMAWLYAHTNASLLLVMLLHAAVNNTKDIVPSALPGATRVFTLHASLVAWLTVALLWIFGIYFLLRMPESEPDRDLAMEKPK